MIQQVRFPLVEVGRGNIGCQKGFIKQEAGNLGSYCEDSSIVRHT